MVVVSGCTLGSSFIGGKSNVVDSSFGVSIFSLTGVDTDFSSNFEDGVLEILLADSSEGKGELVISCGFGGSLFSSLGVSVTVVVLGSDCAS